MEPLGKMNAYFPVINEHISKRNKKVCRTRAPSPRPASPFVSVCADILGCLPL